MAKCKMCGRRGFFLLVSTNGLCKSCNPIVVMDVQQRGRIINDCVRLVRESKNVKTRLSRCDLLIEHARALLEYEHRGIPTVRPCPSRLLSEYSAVRDQVVFEGVTEEVQEPLGRAKIAAAPRGSPPQRAKKRRHRLWPPLLVLAALIAAPFTPKFPLWLGIIMLALCIAAVIPRVQGPSRRVLKLNPAERWRSGLRLTMYGLVGVVLLVSSLEGARFRADQKRAADERVAHEVEQHRLVNQANAQVRALAKEAEEAWRGGNAKLASEKLNAAARTEHATDLSPGEQLRRRVANAEVQSLVTEATAALKAGGIDTNKIPAVYKHVALETLLNLARAKLDAALAVPHATELSPARDLRQRVQDANDPARIRAILMDLSDVAFSQFKDRDMVPSQLLSGYAVLDWKAADLARGKLDEVAAAQQQRRQEQWAAAEAARKAEEERKAQELAAAGIDLNASVQITVEELGGLLIVENKDGFAWTNVKFEINPGFIRGGYIYHAPRIEAGEVYTVGTFLFAKSDGTRLNIFSIKPQKISIWCDTPKGKGFYFGGWQ